MKEIVKFEIDDEIAANEKSKVKVEALQERIASLKS
jgi:hypothetical protein